jgi:hypothetical protein
MVESPPLTGSASWPRNKKERWPRGSLDIKTRVMVQLAAIIACQAVSEYRVMLGGALNVGVTAVEIKEIVYQAVLYVGLAMVSISGDRCRNDFRFAATATLRRSASMLLDGSRPPCSGRLDGDTKPCCSLAHALIEAQQSEADDRGTRNEQRCEVDGIDCPNRITGKRLTRAVNYLARDSQHLPMSSSLDEVRSTVGSFGLRQFLERHRPQHYAITLDQGQVGRDDDFGLAE